MFNFKNNNLIIILLLILVISSCLSYNIIQNKIEGFGSDWNNYSYFKEKFRMHSKYYYSLNTTSKYYQNENFKIEFVIQDIIFIVHFCYCVLG
mgnify:CR=1 FL=1